MAKLRRSCLKNCSVLSLLASSCLCCSLCIQTCLCCVMFAMFVYLFHFNLSVLSPLLLGDLISLNGVYFFLVRHTCGSAERLASRKLRFYRTRKEQPADRVARPGWSFGFIARQQIPSRKEMPSLSQASPVVDLQQLLPECWYHALRCTTSGSLMCALFDVFLSFYSSTQRKPQLYI